MNDKELTLHSMWYRSLNDDLWAKPHGYCCFL